ncbi:hypothetical protein B0H13DRAFT_2665549, partial [Mycena leptocephala]
MKERLSKSQLLVPHACTSGGSRQAEVYPYNPSIACRASVMTPTTTGEPFGTPSATYARLRARRRRPSLRRTPSREFVTRSASAAGASSVTPQNDAAHMQHIYLHAPLACDLGHLKHSILSRRDLVISAGSDAMHWVERDVLSLPMPSFDDDTRECYLHVHVCLPSTCKPQVLSRPRIRGSPSICRYIIVLTIKTINKEEAMPRRPALTMSVGVDRSAISFVVNTPAYFSSLSSHVVDVHSSVLGPSASEVQLNKPRPSALRFSGHALMLKREPAG